MKFCTIIISLLLVQLIVSCTGSSYVSEVLSRAELLMADHPDSALQVLNLLDRESIRGEKELAEYAFLLTKAQYKNYIDAKNDSLIQISVIYYEKQGMKKELSESLLLKGSIETANRSYSDAMLTLQKAAEIGESLGDNYLLGQIYSNLYDICQWGYNADEVSFAEKALEYYKKTGDNYYILDAQSNLGAAYYRVKDFAKSASLLDSVLTQAVSIADTFSIKKAAPTLARIMTIKKDFAKSDSLLNMLHEQYNYKYRPEDIWSLAESRLASNNREEAINLVEQASTMSMNPVSRMVFCFSAGDFFSRVGDYALAWKFMKDYAIINDSIGTERYKETVMAAQRDFVSQKLEIQEIKESRNILIWLGSFLVILLLMFGVVFYYHRKSQMHSLEMEKLMLQVTDMEVLVSGKNLAIEDLNSQIRNANDDSEKMKKLLNDSYYKRYNQLNDLCVSYFSVQSTVFTKNAIYKEVQKIIDQFGQDRTAIQELEFIVNNTKDNILAKTRTEMPKLKESDYLFFCYTYAGFSSRTISLLMQENIDTIYQHKSRWKKRIESLDIPDKELFLRYL